MPTTPPIGAERAADPEQRPVPRSPGRARPERIRAAHDRDGGPGRGGVAVVSRHSRALLGSLCSSCAREFPRASGGRGPIRRRRVAALVHRLPEVRLVRSSRALRPGCVVPGVHLGPARSQPTPRPRRTRRRRPHCWRALLDHEPRGVPDVWSTCLESVARASRFATSPTRVCLGPPHRHEQPPAEARKPTTAIARRGRPRFPAPGLSPRQRVPPSRGPRPPAPSHVPVPFASITRRTSSRPKDDVGPRPPPGARARHCSASAADQPARAECDRPEAAPPPSSHRWSGPPRRSRVRDPV